MISFAIFCPIVTTLFGALKSQPPKVLFTFSSTLDITCPCRLISDELIDSWHLNVTKISQTKKIFWVVTYLSENIENSSFTSFFFHYPNVNNLIANCSMISNNQLNQSFLTTTKAYSWLLHSSSVPGIRYWLMWFIKHQALPKLKITLHTSQEYKQWILKPPM